jgi:hypothetical protein
LSSQFIFSLHPFLWMMWIWSMERKSIHENLWKMGFLLKISLILLFHPWCIVHSEFFFLHEKSILSGGAFDSSFYFCHSYVHIYYLSCHCFVEIVTLRIVTM